jgi:hypothetical protein
MRPTKKRFVQRQRPNSVKRHEDGREVCLSNGQGRAEYVRRKEFLWQQQGGLCALPACRQRMSLLDTRMTGGDWALTEQQRDDRLGFNSEGRQINELVHKGCLRAWHEQAAASAGQAQSATDAVA